MIDSYLRGGDINIIGRYVPEQVNKSAAVSDEHRKMFNTNYQKILLFLHLILSLFVTPQEAIRIRASKTLWLKKIYRSLKRV